MKGRAVAGGLLVAMVALAVMHGAAPAIPAWPAGAAAWLAGLLLWRGISAGQRLQVIVLTGLGVAALTWSGGLGMPSQWLRIVDQNHALLAMLAAVSFLRLVSQPAADAKHRSMPRGAPAYLRTLFGIHLFGAAINLSAVTILGDRLVGREGMDRRTGTLISRGFSSAALWSPLFAGMALVLTYVPGARLPVLIGVGLPFAVCGLAYTFAEALRSDPERLAGFHGYPIHFESLWVPGALTASVLLAHWSIPNWPVLTVISLLAPVMTGLVLCARRGVAGAGALLVGHARDRLPEMAGELLLFLAAGVLAVGLTDLFGTIGGRVPLVTFTPGVAVTTLVAGVGLAALGIHPVITVTVLATLLGPLRPDPTFAALVFLMIWGLGVAVSPLSATHLVMRGRFDVPSTACYRWNASYVAFMLSLAVVVLHFY